MPIFQWDDELLLGEPLIDEHHKHLVELINTTYDLNKAGVANNGIAAIINELVDYTMYHFQCEEIWMVEIGYGNVAAHKKEHVHISDRILLLQQKIQQGENLSQEVLSFLVEWLVNHIMNSDRKCSLFAMSNRDF